MKKVVVNTENLEIVKCKCDGSVETYTELYTDDHIISIFYRVATKSEVNKGLASQERPVIPVKATDYLYTSIEVVVGIRITGVNVASNLETIRLRASEVIVYRKIPTESVLSENLGIEPNADEGDDSDDDSE